VKCLCGGPADNGHDREYPPNPYVCRLCVAKESLRQSAQWFPALDAIVDALDALHDRLVYLEDLGEYLVPLSEEWAQRSEA